MARKSEWEQEAAAIAQDIASIYARWDRLVDRLETGMTRGEVRDIQQALGSAFDAVRARYLAWRNTVPTAHHVKSGKLTVWRIAFSGLNRGLYALNVLLAGQLLFDRVDQNGDDAQTIRDAISRAEDFYEANMILVTDALAGRWGISHLEMVAKMEKAFEAQLARETISDFAVLSELSERLTGPK